MKTESEFEEFRKLAIMGLTIMLITGLVFGFFAGMLMFKKDSQPCFDTCPCACKP